MSYPEKRTVVSVITGVLLLAAYSIYAFGKAGMANPDNLIFWAKTMLIFIGIGIVATIITQIVFHITLSVGMAVKQKMKDESCDDKEIEKSIEQEMVEDEMGKLIALTAGKIGYSFVGFGFLAGLIALTLGASPVVMLNILFFSNIVGTITEGIVQIRYYRRGL